MLVAKGNIWSAPASAKCITTNGDVNSEGEAVMGKGIAKEAKERYPELPKLLGQRIMEEGNKVFLLFSEVGDALIMVPTKEHWYQRSTMVLVYRSMQQLVALCNEYPEWTRILLPKPGCGNGGLDWSMVKPQIEQLLDNRFIVVDKK